MSATFSDPPNLGALRAEVEAYHAARSLRDQWLSRKVTQFDYLDIETINKSISFDVDIARLREIFTEFGPSCERKRLLLPLDATDQRPYMTNFLESPWGAEACLATRRERAYFRTVMFFAVLHNSDSDNLWTRLGQTTIRQVFDSFVYPPQNIDFDKNICEDLGYSFGDGSLKRGLDWVRESVLILLNVPNDEANRAFIKFSFTTGAVRVDRQSYSRRMLRFYGALERWGIRSSSIVITNVDGDQNLSLHLRVLIPEGMRADYVQPELANNSKTSKEVLDYLGQVTHRKNGRVVSLYAPPPARMCNRELVRDSRLNLKIIMNPKRAIFALPALAASVLSLLIAQALALYFIHHLGENSVGVVSPVQGLAPMAALIPTFISSRVLVANEHEAVSFALGFRRSLLGAGAFFSVALSTLLAFDMADKHINSALQAGLYFYVLGQLFVALFFIFDIVRIQIWRNGSRTDLSRSLIRHPVLIVISFVFLAIFLWFAWYDSSLLLSICE